MSLSCSHLDAWRLLFPASLIGLREASLWPGEVALLAGPAMGACEQWHAGLQ